MNDESEVNSFLWFIENYSFCSHRNVEKLDSPEFRVDGLEGTAWFQRLYPRGYSKQERGYTSLFLYRSPVDDGPDTLQVEFEVSVLAADGSALRSLKSQHAFRKGGGFGFHKFLLLVFPFPKTNYLSEDTLCLQCKIWKDKEATKPVTLISARTSIRTQTFYFLHVVESFSTIEPNQKKTIQIRYPTKDEGVLSSSVYFSESPGCEGKVMVEITFTGTNNFLRKCKFSLLNASGVVRKCGETKYPSDATREVKYEVPLSLAWKTILHRKDEYLSDDKLSLLCECVFTSGEVYTKLETILHKIPSMTLCCQIFNSIKDSSKKSVLSGELTDYPSALDDLKAIYNTKFHTDVELKTMTKSYSAHKIVLCARSPVFKAMMSNDMREKNTDCVTIDDLDDDTIHQLLPFLYSDYLEDLRWETATKLYYAADKYEIKKLKMICSNFLKDKLSTSTATELLILADTHNDYDLRRVVEDFILKHEEEVFGSDEWEKLIETNPQLVIKTMHVKYKRKVN